LEFGEWGSFGACSATCGGGTQTRYSFVRPKFHEKRLAKFPLMRQIFMYVKRYGFFEYASSLKVKIDSRTRECGKENETRTENCSGTSIDTQPCNQHQCPVGKIIQCPQLNRITLGSHENDNNNRMIQLTDEFFVLYYNYIKRLILVSVIQSSGRHCILDEHAYQDVILLIFL